MADQVSGLAGYNFYLDDGAGNKTKLNTTPLGEGVHFTVDGLDSNTDYSGLLFVSSVDNNANESSLVAFTGLNAKTISSTPDQEPMGSADVALVENAVARCIAQAGNQAIGWSVAIISPKGYFTKSYGSGMSNDGHYRIASVTKTFTGHAILMAIDNGLITLDDTLDTYYTGVANGNIITIRHMLMMQSGVYDYQAYPNLGLNFTLNPMSAMSVEQIMAYIKSGPSMFTPGTAYQYTNSNYYLLGKVLEAVDPTHRTYDQIITQDIITPLGLTETYCPAITDFGVKAPADTGYDNGPLGLALFGKRVVRDQNPAYIWAAGYIISTVGDIAKWTKELRDGTLLSPEMHDLRETLFAEQPNVGAARYGLDFSGPPTFGYGLGFIRVGAWRGHDGSWLGYDGCCMYEPHTGSIIVVAENFQTTSPHILASLTVFWYEIAQALYPGSGFYEGFMESESGSMTGTLQHVGSSISAQSLWPNKVALPFTMPGTFGP